MRCASSGWSVEASARIAIFAPRRFRCRALARRRTVVMKDGIASWRFYYITGGDLNACARTVFAGAEGNDDQVETAAAPWLSGSANLLSRPRGHCAIPFETHY